MNLPQAAITAAILIILAIGAIYAWHLAGLPATGKHAARPRPPAGPGTALLTDLERQQIWTKAFTIARADDTRDDLPAVTR